MYPYIEDNQLKRILGQVMRAFSQFQYRKSGDSTETKRVPVTHASIERAVAKILSPDGSTSTLPIISVEMQSIDINNTREISSRPHSVKDFVSTSEPVLKLDGVPLSLGFVVSVAASSKTELFQIIEQIMITYRKPVKFTYTNNAHGRDSISQLVMTGFNNELRSPVGTDSDTHVISSLLFKCDVTLSVPRIIVDEIVERINSTVSSPDITIHDVITGETL